MYVFGVSTLFGTAENGAPINFGVADEVTLNISTTTRALFGNNDFPVAIGSGTRKMSAKAKFLVVVWEPLRELMRLQGDGPSVVFSANLAGRDPTTGRSFSLLLYHCVAERPPPA